MSDDMFAALHAKEREFERTLNRKMLPIVLPMVIASGALLGLLIFTILSGRAPSYSGAFMLAAVVFGVSPLAVVIIKYR